ncbi:MAG: sugar phosphate isomerase/epimerase family protein [Thermocladium sp.]
MRKSITTILWGKFKNEKEFLTTLKYIKQLGYDSVGLEVRMLPSQLLREPRKVKDALEEVGLENGGSYSVMKEQDIEWAKAAGSRLLWVVVREKNCNDALRILAEFTDKASSEGITVALHNHLRTCFENENQVLNALESIPKLKICLDTAHAEAAGIDSIKFINEHTNKIGLVHLKDLRVKAPKSKIRFTRDFVNMGNGIIDFKPIINALKNVKYGGDLMIEVEALSGQSPNDIARNSIEYLNKLLQ